MYREAVHKNMVCLAIALLAQSASDSIQLNVDGQTREALVFPGDSSSGPKPVIFAFHGHGGTSRFAARSYDLQSQWPGAVIVYAQGVPRSGAIVDPEGKRNGWDVSVSESNPDIKFFDALYRTVMAKYNGDPNRVYAMGHSNGGFFIYTLWALRADKFAAFGSAEAAGATRTTLSPKPIFVTIGDEDKIVPPRLQKRSLSAVFRTDGSAESGEPFGPKGTLYAGKQPVILWSYQGGHTFPGDCVPSMIAFFQKQTRQ